MNIIIENADTLEYLTRDGRWSPHSKDAAIYPSSAKAKQFGTSAAIGKFNVIGAFRNSPQLTNLDVGCGTKA